MKVFVQLTDKENLSDLFSKCLGNSSCYKCELTCDESIVQEYHPVLKIDGAQSWFDSCYVIS